MFVNNVHPIGDYGDLMRYFTGNLLLNAHASEWISKRGQRLKKLCKNLDGTHGGDCTDG